ncbi:MAG TPA: efflux RND transporter periplasmic adaptor subunit [Vicinamibacterales bacterium]|nr:efflux RND transporter periplasmic adaptor subunit [Vicinamibacterales bacterium]
MAHCRRSPRAPRARRALRVRLPLLCAILLAASVLASCKTGTAAPPPPPPPEVRVVTVAPERVTLTSEWIATLDGYVNAQIRPQVSGYLLKRDYEEGAVVRKGQTLFEIDARPFIATRDQMRAQLGEARAQLGKAERDLQRDRPLAEQRAIAQSQLDNDVQADLAAQASVNSAAAAVETAELNLGFTKVTSLIDGVAAIATAQIGDLVGPSTLLTTVSQIDPIKAYFPLSEQEYLQIAGRINAPGTSTASRAPWQGAAGLTLILADGSVYPRTGSFLAADREIDAKTGTIRISARFPNPNHLLRPGEYGRVRAETRVRADALLVPQRAVNELQGSFQVRVVGPDNKVSTRTVKVGERVGSRWVIDGGLEPGARVVVEGGSLSDGAVVNPRAFTAPAAEP